MKMKKLLAIILAVVLVCATATTAFATELYEEFELKQASNGMTYGVYTPFKYARMETQGKKFPLVVYVHGLGHAWNDNSFRQSGLTYWARSDMQSKFKEGGAYLLCPKIPETSVTALQTEKVFELIDEYVKSNPKVDTDQIYIMGGSAGGALTWRLIINHPGYFKRAVILCACKITTPAELEAVKDTPIWQISAVNDPFVWWFLFSRPNWSKLTNTSNVNEKNRHTVFTGTVSLPDGSNAAIPHLLAKTIGYNLCYLDSKEPLRDMYTVDGNGDTVDISFNDSIVEWLQEDVPTLTTCAPECFSVWSRSIVTE